MVKTHQLIIFALILTLTSITSSKIFTGEDMDSGFIQINKRKWDEDKLFYWLFRSRTSPDTDPLVIWLTGGPGCSGEIAAVWENGPYIYKNGDLKSNKYSWNNIANLLYLD